MDCMSATRPEPGLRPRTPPRPTLRAVAVRRLVLGTVAVVVLLLMLRGLLDPAWSTPGSPQLYWLGVLGSLCCLVPFAYALAKRSARVDSPPRWFIMHAVAGCVGTGLLVLHSGLHLDQAPALMLLAAVVLVAQGLWARTLLPRLQSARFGSRHVPFLGAGTVDRVRLAEVIDAKRALLPRIESGADEALFSLRPVHWLRAPRAAARYASLVAEERALVGQHAALPRAERYWRRVHVALAWLFLAGMAIHVVTVTLFAGYVADGGPITWWHLAAWGGPQGAGG